MEYIRIRRSQPLEGRVKVNGAKNAALPILAATLLGTEDIFLSGLPHLRDVDVMLEVLQALGVEVEACDEDTLRLNASRVDKQETPAHLMNKMRASFVVMGPLLSRYGRTKTYLPGGCAIGERPVDLHLKGFQALGASLDIEPEYIEAQAPPEGLQGNAIYLDFPSVGATENIMMAATLAKGHTIIENVAKEPEIVDLANFLNKMGAEVKGAGTSVIEIDGVEKLTGCRHTIIPDRIEAATFLIAGAMTGGHVRVENVIASHIRPIIAKLKEAGAEVVESDDEDVVIVQGKLPMEAIKIRTMPYPGFPTDAQAQFMSLMTICRGQSQVEETVFENRFMHADELNKMGALIATNGNEAIIRGVDHLVGAKVNATDLRAAAALVIAGLVAEGETEVHQIYHLDRGYYNLEGRLRALGGDVVRIKKEED